MSNLDDINKLMKDMMGNFPFDTIGVEKAFKSSALLNEKLANVALDAASKSTEISTTWAKNTLGKLQVVSSAKEEPANKGQTEYKVRWKGYSPADDTWESEESLASAMVLVREFEEKRRQKAAMLPPPVITSVQKLLSYIKTRPEVLTLNTHTTV